MSENLQKVLEEFLKETGLESIATGIVDCDGRVLAYEIRGAFDKDFKSQRAASIFSMVVNFLNKTLGEVYFKDDEVEEMQVTLNNGYFLMGVIETDNCWHGVVVNRDEDINKIRQLIRKYKYVFLAKL